MKTDVRVMERRPPPAPARAWAMLSPCWALEAAETATRGLSMGLDMMWYWRSTEELGLKERKLSTYDGMRGATWPYNRGSKTRRADCTWNSGATLIG